MSQNKRRRHSPQQIVEKLQGGGSAVECGATAGSGAAGAGGQRGDVPSLAGPYGGMKASEAKRLKELEQENARLKKLLADAHLDNDILKSALDHLGNE